MLVSAVIVKLIGALFKIPLSADYALGDLGFGYFSAVYDLYIPIYTLAFSGFPVAIARMVADFTAKNDTHNTRRIFLLSFKVLLIIGVIGAFIFCAIAVFLLFDKNDSGFRYSFAAISPAAVFCCIASVYRGYFEGKKNMIPTAVSNVIEALAKLILGLTGAIVTMKLTDNPALASAAALIGIAIGTLGSAIYLKHCFKKYGNMHTPFSKDEKKFDKSLFAPFMALLIPVAISSLSVGVTAFIDSLTLKGCLEGIIAENGANARLLLKDTIYQNIDDSQIPTLLYGIKGKAHTLFNLVPTLTTALGIGAVPLIAECFAKGDVSSLKKNSDFCMKLSSCISFPVAAGFMAIGPQIMELLYGDKSAVLGGKLLALYGVAVIFAGISVPTTAILQAVGHQKTALVNILFGVVFKLFCSLTLASVPKINVYAAAIGTGGCFVIIFGFNMISLIKKSGLFPDMKICFLRPFIAALFCGISAFGVTNLANGKTATVLAIFVAAVIYIICLFCFKVITKDDIRDLVKI